MKNDLMILYGHKALEELKLRHRKVLILVCRVNIDVAAVFIAGNYFEKTQYQA
jgi:hypothetical protein